MSFSCLGIVGLLWRNGGGLLLKLIVRYLPHAGEELLLRDDAIIVRVELVGHLLPDRVTLAVLCGLIGLSDREKVHQLSGSELTFVVCQIDEGVFEILAGELDAPVHGGGDELRVFDSAV